MYVFFMESFFLISVEQSSNVSLMQLKPQHLYSEVRMCLLQEEEVVGI